MIKALLSLISLSLVLSANAAGYTDKNGNPAPNPCNEGENVFFNELIFNCINRQKVYYGCKVKDIEYKQDTVKDENNLRTLYCHKDGNSVKTIVTGCVTDDNQFIDGSKTVTQADGTEFACTKEANGFSYVKKSPPTKVSDCVQGETKVVGSRYLLECYEESSGYFTYKLAACYASLNNEATQVKALSTQDDYVSGDKQLGFRYSCHAQGNSFFYEPVGCLLGEQFIAPGDIFQNGSLTIMCIREGPQLLRLRPVYSSSGGENEKACTESKTFIEDHFKYECVSGQLPKPVACVFFKDKKEIAIGETYNDDKAYQYKCEHTLENKHLALIKVACLDDENQVLVEGGKKTLSDGSRIECQRDSDNGLLRVIVAGKPPIKGCQNGEKFVRDYIQYQCQGEKSTPFACAPLNNDSLIIEIEKTHETENYQYKCEKRGNAIIYHATACFDVDKKLLIPGEKRPYKIFIYECQRKANGELALVISNEQGCKHPTLQGKLVRPNDIVEVSKTINKLDYKVLFQCSRGGEKGYHLIDDGCKVDGKKYEIGYFLTHERDVYKCVRPIAGGTHLIFIPINQMVCRHNGKVYNNGDEFKSADGISQYQCLYGKIVKIACFVHDKRIPANQLMYCNDEPFFCPGQGDGVIPIPIRGCYRNNGQLMKIGESFNEKDVSYACTYTHYNNIYKPVIVPIGCIYNGKLIPLNSYIFYQNKNIVCEVDSSFTVISHPATPEQEQCIAKTATYNCQSDSNGNGEGGQATSSTYEGGKDYTATPSSGQGGPGQSGDGEVIPGGGKDGVDPFPDDDRHTTTKTSQSGNNEGEEDCDDVTTTGEPGEGFTGGYNPGTTKEYGGSGIEEPFPTDEYGNVVTSKGYTATGSNHEHYSNEPASRTTKISSGTGDSNPFPTDDNGNVVTGNSDHVATGDQGGFNTNEPGSRTTKSSGSGGDSNPFPTDENGNVLTTYPGGHVATGDQSGYNSNGPGSRTTKSSGGSGDSNPFPTDENGNIVTGYLDHIATGDQGGFNTYEPGSRTTRSSGGSGDSNPFPTDDSKTDGPPGPGQTKNPHGSTENPNNPSKTDGPPGPGRTNDPHGSTENPNDPSKTDGPPGPGQTKNPHRSTENPNNPSKTDGPYGPGQTDGPPGPGQTNDPHGSTENPNDPSKTDGPSGPEPTDVPPGPGRTNDPHGSTENPNDPSNTDGPPGPGQTKNPHRSTENPNDPSKTDGPPGPGRTNDPHGSTKNPNDPSKTDGPSGPGQTDVPPGSGRTNDPHGSTENPNGSSPSGPGYTRDPKEPNQTENPYETGQPGDTVNPTDDTAYSTQLPPNHSTPSYPANPQSCKDLLPKDICLQLKPLCLQNSPNKVKPQTSKKTLPEVPSIVKTKCFALQQQCQSKMNPSSCKNYIKSCSTNLNTKICEVTTTCKATKEIYKTVTGEIISKLCPETCLVQQCFDKHTRPDKLDLQNFLQPELLTCLLA